MTTIGSPATEREGEGGRGGVDGGGRPCRGPNRGFTLSRNHHPLTSFIYTSAYIPFYSYRISTKYQRNIVF